MGNDNTKTLYLDIGRHLMQDDAPSVYLNGIHDDKQFRQYPFDMLYRLKSTKQSLAHHPEGNVWNHTMLVVDEAARVKLKSKNPEVFMWAALLHDIGKPSATTVRKGKITSYDHDKLGARLCKEFMLAFTEDVNFADEVSRLVRYHMQILFVVKSLPFADIEGMRRETDIREVALLGLCDRLGRGNCDKSGEENNIKLFLQKCNVSPIVYT
ncbi:MAG: multifunctional tRNA nucleotidyl transferase/2'3'-cyclic phosphodiesterase/2'nucleotidase/phosphatase [Firmicutes bacterium ADurb.Bin193]|nr:MAG: multifunctional tRNA nucleotidyl transferase/2'3'-cyclic phosphodiesterase/2'nucleotidase/phosphatase [Firmicutes bacterium ADurb.Bin193]